jgi:hypothetical protein
LLLIIRNINRYEIQEENINEHTFIEFIKRVDEQILKLNNFIDYIISQGQNVYIYGASTKGNCLLQYAKIFNDRVKYAVERNPDKFGKVTSTGIEIISETEMRKNPPDYLLVLPWHFRKNIIQREHVFLKNGGQIILPLPKFEIISYKQ